MADPFISEIRIFSFSFAPKSWAFANGQLLPIQQNQALFSLLGTTYGGDGRVNFQLPDLRGRLAIGYGTASSGNAYTLGQQAGEENHTLLVTEIPSHTHNAAVNTASGTQASPVNGFWAVDSNGGDQYAPGAPNLNLNAAAVSQVGGNQGHPNLMPYTIVSFCIALTGIFPSRN